jgi:beta-mannosidase
VFSDSLHVKEPKLWNPNGHGEQNLYTLKVTITDKAENGETSVSDQKQYKVGLKTISYERCENSPEDSLPYIPVINGKKIYIKGVNMSPCEMMYGCETKEKLKKLFSQAKEKNINLVRVWGGGAIESFDFYDLCDEAGIMVWQEFIQSSSGIDNTPSKLPKFLDLIEKVSSEALRTKRNHACLTFWSGGNELTDENGIPSTYEDENIKLLKSLCDRYDPAHLMLPTSASGPGEFIDVENKGKSHDVHGHWKYLGAFDHYKFYNKSDSLLHSEFGCDGMTNPDKIGRFLSKQHHKVFSMAENAVWRHHGEWWDTLGRETAIFGEFDKDDLLGFIKLSQVIQADGLRYILDANRRRKFENAGSIIWQYNEPYPNVSCTSLADYWGDGKLALDYVGQAYRPANVSLKHDSLVYSQGDIFAGEVYAVNDLSEMRAKIGIKVSDEAGNLILEKSENAEIGENGSVKVCDISFRISDSPCYHVDLTLDDGEHAIHSKYFFLVKGESGHCEKWPVEKIYDSQKNEKILC